jgi:hypothetical protein
MQRLLLISLIALAVSSSAFADCEIRFFPRKTGPSETSPVLPGALTPDGDCFYGTDPRTLECYPPPLAPIPPEGANDAQEHQLHWRIYANGRDIGLRVSTLDKAIRYFKTYLQDTCPRVAQGSCRIERGRRIPVRVAAVVVVATSAESAPRDGCPYGTHPMTLKCYPPPLAPIPYDSFADGWHLVKGHANATMDLPRAKAEEVLSAWIEAGYCGTDPEEVRERLQSMVSGSVDRCGSP